MTSPTKAIGPTATERFRAAFRLLTKGGDDAVICSFCGKGRDKLSHIVAGPGVAICWDCARIAANIAYDLTMHPVTGGSRWITVAPVLEPSEKLTSSQRSALHETLTQQAVAHGCELLTWHYVCGHQVAGDYLGFNVTCTDDADRSALQLAMKASCRQALELPALENGET